MSPIKFSHVHENGKGCYIVDPGRTYPFSRVHLLTLVRGFGKEMRGVQLAIGYKPAVGSWYVYDVSTGEELGTVRGELAEYLKDLVHASIDMDSKC